MKMSEQPSHNLGGLEIDLARRVDAICRRFEADWREGYHPRPENYLLEIPKEGRPAPRAELEAVEGELRPSNETVARPEDGLATAPELRTTRPPSIVAEAPIMGCEWQRRNYGSVSIPFLWKVRS